MYSRSARKSRTFALGRPRGITLPEAEERARPRTTLERELREGSRKRERAALPFSMPRRTAPHCAAVLHPDRTCVPASLLGPSAGPRCRARPADPPPSSNSPPASTVGLVPSARDPRRAFFLRHHLLPTLHPPSLVPHIVTRSLRSFRSLRSASLRVINNSRPRLRMENRS